MLSKKDFLAFSIIAISLVLGVSAILAVYKKSNTVLPIVEVSDHALREPSPEIDKVDGSIVSVSNDMISTLRYRTLRDIFSKGSIPRGLAAPQVGVSKRLVVCGLHGDIKVMINPRILDKNGTYESTEGCLSILGGRVNRVNRSAYVKFQYTGLDNQERILVVRNRDAALIEHEIDHLDGVLNVDYLAEKQLESNISKIF